jgi:carbonic anhydrase/acetyltransferase-like protein (isoleucine patch superfamily)
VTDAIIGRACEVGHHAVLRGGVLGDHTHIADYSKL